MNKIISSVSILLVFCDTSYAQTTFVKYYKDEYCLRETKKEKANFEMTRFSINDSSATMITDLQTGIVVHSEIFKGKEQFGIWKIRTSSGIQDLDFNFNLVYSDSACSETDEIKIANDFKDDESANYQSPKTNKGDLNTSYFFGMNTRYPAMARENNIEGKVFIRFIITETGAVEDISIYKSANVWLDKEAMRVLRLLKFTSPAMLKGAPIRKCFQLPVEFKFG